MLALVLATFLLWIVTPQYRATLMVAPNDLQFSSTRTSSLSALGNISSLIGLNGMSRTVDTFERFRLQVNSVSVDRALTEDQLVMHTVFANQWDQAHGRWVPPNGLKPQLGLAFRWFFGRGGWTAPSEEDMAEYIARHVVLKPMTEGRVLQLQYHHHDAKFAVYLISKIFFVVDQQIKISDRERFLAYRDYLAKEILATTVMEYRTSLSGILTELAERAMLVGEDGVSYASQILDGPWATPRPVSPSVPLVLTIASLLGIAGGVVYSALDKMFALPKLQLPRPIPGRELLRVFKRKPRAKN